MPGGAERLDDRGGRRLRVPGVGLVEVMPVTEPGQEALHFRGRQGPRRGEGRSLGARRACGCEGVRGCIR
jgi:hypothetical protein